MKYILTSFLISFSLSISSQQTINKSIEHNGELRSYILYIPEAFVDNEETPLVLCFHGYGSSAETISSYANFQAIADTANFIIAFPEGAIHDNSSHWNVEGWIENSPYDDIGFTEFIIDDISSEYTINQERIYSTGMSNGGFMSFLLACQLSPKIAAVASVTGSITPQNLENCSPEKFIPFLQIHGTSDFVIPYEFPVTHTESIPSLLEYWTTFNECSAEPSLESLPNISTSDGSTVEKYTYFDCTNNIENIHFKVIGGGHDWPGAWGNMDVNASEEIWKFFAQYDINGPINTTTSLQKISKAEISIYPNPTSDYIIIENLTSTTTVTIFSLDGRVLLSKQVEADNPQLSLLGLCPNFYLVEIDEEIFKVVVID